MTWIRWGEEVTVVPPAVRKSDTAYPLYPPAMKVPLERPDFERIT